MIVRTTSEAVFACHEASCRPPTSGGTGGSGGGVYRHPEYGHKLDEASVREFAPRPAYTAQVGNHIHVKNNGNDYSAQITAISQHPTNKDRLKMTVQFNGGTSKTYIPGLGETLRLIGKPRGGGGGDGHDARKDARLERADGASGIQRGKYPRSNRTMYKGKGNFG